MTNNIDSTVCSNAAKAQIPDRILIAIDTHADYYVVGRQIDCSAPQSLRRCKPSEFMDYALSQRALAREVHVIYEAGPFGYGLARELASHGISCIVAAPAKLDPYNKGVRTDKRDTRELLFNLDRYLRGNKRALRPVRIPTLEQEMVRARNRQRDALCRDQRAVASRGRTLLLHFGRRHSNHWWKANQWDQLCATLPAQLRDLLERYRIVILDLSKLIAALEKKIVAQAPATLPAGMGKLTFVLLLQEVLTWSRFKTRRQVGGFTGLCGGVLQSGPSHQNLSITKTGHTRIRTLLVEMAWRMLRYQPDCHLVKKWGPRLAACGTNKSRRKQIIVAMARQLAVDIWKWQTSATTPEAFGWKMVSTT
jgi:transposase